MPRICAASALLTGSVVVDTSVWIDFLRDPRDPSGGRLQQLLEEGRVLLCSLVMAELLAGARSHEEFEDLRGALAEIPKIPEIEQDWVEAARIRFGLRRAGRDLPLLDCLIAAVCLRLSVPLFSRDSDFSRIPGLRHFQ